RPRSGAGWKSCARKRACDFRGVRDATAPLGRHRRMTMKRLHGTRAIDRGGPPILGMGPRIVAPILAVGTILGLLMVVVVTALTLAAAMLLPHRKRIRVVRMHGKGGRVPPHYEPDDVPPPAAGEPDKAKSYAEVLELWPLVLAATLLAPAVAHAK